MAIGQFNEFGLGFLVLKFDLVSHQGERRARRSVSSSGDDSQGNFGSLWAADQLHRLAQTHIDNIHGRLVALRDRNNLVVLFDLFAFGCWSSWQKPVNDAI